MPLPYLWRQREQKRLQHEEWLRENAPKWRERARLRRQHEQDLLEGSFERQPCACQTDERLRMDEPCARCGLSLNQRKEFEEAGPPDDVWYWNDGDGEGALERTLRDVRKAFAEIREPGQRFPIVFWLNMLDQQVIEAREHVAAGRLDKALAEVADCFSVGWQALADHDKEPAEFIEHRIRTRVIPRAEELHERDKTGGGYNAPRPGGDRR